MERRDEFTQMPSQKIERHFDCQKLMLLLRLTRRGQRFIAAPIKTDGQRCEGGPTFMEAHSTVAFAIQADFDTAGMKAITPIEFLSHRKVMPLEAQSSATHAAMQVAPAVSDRMPDRPFGERRQMVGLVVDFDWSLGRLRHADNVPIRNPGASPNQETGVRSQQFRPARVKKNTRAKVSSGRLLAT